MSGDFQLRPGGFGFLLFQVCETQLYTNTDTTIQLKSERNLTLWLLEMRNLELSLFAIWNNWNIWSWNEKSGGSLKWEIWRWTCLRFETIWYDLEMRNLEAGGCLKWEIWIWTLKQLKYVCDEKSGGCLQDLRGSNLLSDLYSSWTKPTRKES